MNNKFGASSWFPIFFLKSFSLEYHTIQELRGGAGGQADLCCRMTTVCGWHANYTVVELPQHQHHQWLETPSSKLNIDMNEARAGLTDSFRKKGESNRAGGLRQSPN